LGRRRGAVATARYSSSKAAVELLVALYRESYLDPARSGEDHRIALSSARAGNVIGCGDWSVYRIVPDAVRAPLAGRAIRVRNPLAVRPWQHVIDPIGGYLVLASKMANASTTDERQRIFGPFNFGPDPSSARCVEELIERILEEWPGDWITGNSSEARHEAVSLALPIEKARRDLARAPAWGFDEAVMATVAWYRAAASDESGANGITRRQIIEYSEQFEPAQTRDAADHDQILGS